MSATSRSVRARVHRHLAMLCADALEAEVRYEDLADLMDRLKRAVILSTLDASNWSVVKAARALGIHRNTLSRQISNLGIKRPPRGARQKCRCGRDLSLKAFPSHMRWHVRRGDARIFLPEDSDRFDYQWLRQPEAA